MSNVNNGMGLPRHYDEITPAMTVAEIDRLIREAEPWVSRSPATGAFGPFRSTPLETPNPFYNAWLGEPYQPPTGWTQADQTSRRPTFTGRVATVPNAQTVQGHIAQTGFAPGTVADSPVAYWPLNDAAGNAFQFQNNWGNSWTDRATRSYQAFYDHVVQTAPQTGCNPPAGEPADW